MTPPAPHPIETIPARRGVGLLLSPGESLRVINVHGSQVVDLFAFNAHDLSEFLSLEHWRVQEGRTIPIEGSVLVTNRRRAILSMVEDTSGGPHDTLCAACDRYRYWSLGHPAGDVHDNCTDNLAAALTALGYTGEARMRAGAPCPLNLFQNVPPRPDGGMTILPPAARGGGHVTLRAEIETALVLSACPMDMADTNGADRRTMDAAYQRI